MQTSCQQPVDRLRLREMNKEWDDLDMLQDVGINTNNEDLFTASTRTKRLCPVTPKVRTIHNVHATASKDVSPELHIAGYSPL